MEYTKGEWKARLILGIYVIVATAGRGIAIILGRPESKANAHLIAAAPKMHKWLKEIGLHMAVNYSDENEPYFIIDNDYLAEAHTILAEAEGK